MHLNIKADAQEILNQAIIGIAILRPLTLDNPKYF